MQITLDLTKETINAEVLATILQTKTTRQKDEDFKKEVERLRKEFKNNLILEVNTDILTTERHYFRKTFDSRTQNYLIDRDTVVNACQEVAEMFRKQGYTIRGYGRYADSNSKWYELIIML